MSNIHNSINGEKLKKIFAGKAAALGGVGGVGGHEANSPNMSAAAAAQSHEQATQATTPSIGCKIHNMTPPCTTM